MFSGVLGIVAAIHPIVIPLGVFVGVCLAGFIYAQFRAFHKVRVARDEALDSLAAAGVQPKPLLEFGEPYVRLAKFRDATDRGNVVHTTSFVNVGVVNHGGLAADDVVVVQSFETLNGEKLAADAKANWADKHNQGERAIRIAANGDPQAIDIVAKYLNENAAWVYDEHSPNQLKRSSHELDRSEFIVKLRAKASNAEPAELKIHIRNHGAGKPLEIIEWRPSND